MLFLENEKPITSPKDIVNPLRLGMKQYEEQEQFWVVVLNGENKSIGGKMITLGLANQTQVHPREAFKFAIRCNAISVIFAHNHPSGSTTPSKEDIQISEILSKAGKLLGIPVLDHIIITKNGWNSIKSTHPSIFESN